MGPLGLITVIYLADLAFQPTNYPDVPKIDLVAAQTVAGDPFSATPAPPRSYGSSESPVALMESLGLLDSVRYVEWRGHLIILD